MNYLLTDLEVLNLFYDTYFRFKSKKCVLGQIKQDDICAFVNKYAKNDKERLKGVLAKFVFEFWNINNINNKPSKERMMKFLDNTDN